MSLSANIQGVALNDYLELVAVVVLYYDHLITLPAEITRIWPRARSKPALWFFLNRYVPFLAHIIVVVFTLADMTPSDKSCKSYGLFHQLLLVFNQTVVSTLLGLRTFAFYGNSLIVLAVLCALGAASVILGCLFLIKQHSTVITGGPLHGCHTGLSFISGVEIVVPWEGQFLFDVTVFGLTIYKSFQHRNESEWARRKISWSNLGLMELIFRDGAIYFGVMALVNLANIFTFYLTSDPLRGILSTFASCISITMMSRLILNLHDAASLLPSTRATTVPMAFAPPRNLAATTTGFMKESGNLGVGEGGAERAIEIQEVDRGEGPSRLDRDNLHA